MSQLLGDRLFGQKLPELQQDYPSLHYWKFCTIHRFAVFYN